MNPQDPEQSTTNIAVERGLAVIGFAALVACGIWLAIYSSRFVPTAVEGLGAAAVALSSVFVPGDATLSVVPATTTPIFFGEATTTETKPEPNPVTPKPTPTAGIETSIILPISTSTTGTNTPYGLSDLVATILTTGYLTSASTDSFIASSTVPTGMRAAVRFSIANRGTNITPTGWHFSASIPTRNAYVFYSPEQQALSPGDSIEYTLGFDQPSPGTGHSISIVADSDQRVSESIEGNNSASAQITVLGN